MKKYLSLVLILAFISCGPEKVEVVIPDDVLSIEEMIDMTVEMAIIDGTYSSQVVLKGNKGNRKKSYYKSLFKDKGLSQEAYTESYDWYSQHPKKFFEVYEGIISTLEKQQKEIKKEAAAQLSK